MLDACKIEGVGRGESILIAGLGVMLTAEIGPFGTRNENLGEVDAADAVVSVAIEVDQRTDKPIGGRSVHGVADEDGMLYADVFHHVGIADGGGYTSAADVGFAAENRRRPIDLIFGDGGADERERSATHVNAAATVVVLADFRQVRIVFREVAGDGGVCDGHAGEIGWTTRERENSS